MRCEMCMRRMVVAERGRKVKRLLFQTAEHDAIYEIMVCNKCMEEIMRFIYRRREDREQLDQPQDEEPEDIQGADERGAVVLRK